MCESYNESSLRCQQCNNHKTNDNMDGCPGSMGECVKKVVNKANKIEEWKQRNCYDEKNISCIVCCSGGVMAGSMCTSGSYMMKRKLGV